MNLRRLAVTILAAIVLATSAAVPVAAVALDTNGRAGTLNRLQILRGTGTDYNLGGQLRRSEAATFIVRIMGKEALVLQDKPRYTQTPFTDVPADQWYAPYVGYCYANRIISGFDDGTYRPNDYVSEKAFLKLVLGSLGYQQNTDFTWADVYRKALAVGLVTDPAYASKSADDPQYRREGVVNVLYSALDKKEKGGTRTVLARLRNEGAITKETSDAVEAELRPAGAGNATAGGAVSGGTPPGSSATSSAFQPASPISTFTKEDIDYLGASFTGTPAQIADAIYQWQGDHMTYQANGGDVSDPMRWNYFLPGIYPTSEMIREMRQDGKVYGLCYGFATIYVSLAKYYGLEARVTAMNEKPSQLDPTIDKNTTTGLGPDEYDRLKVKLDRRGLNYSYETIRGVAQETSAHYRAEVKLNGNWVVKDATELFFPNTYNSRYTFYEVDWMEGYHPEKLAAAAGSGYGTGYGFSGAYGSSGGTGSTGGTGATGATGGAVGSGGSTGSAISLEGITAARLRAQQDGSSASYQGITDDLGQNHRAASIDDLTKGLGLVPYYRNWADAARFLKMQTDFTKEFAQTQAVEKMYFATTGKHFYAICGYIIGDDVDNATYSQWYEVLTGEKIDLRYVDLFR